MVFSSFYPASSSWKILSSTQLSFKYVVEPKRLVAKWPVPKRHYLNVPHPVLQCCLTEIVVGCCLSIISDLRGRWGLWERLSLEQSPSVRRVTAASSVAPTVCLWLLTPSASLEGFRGWRPSNIQDSANTSTSSDANMVRCLSLSLIIVVISRSTWWADSI